MTIRSSIWYMNLDENWTFRGKRKTELTDAELKRLYKRDGQRKVLTSFGYGSKSIRTAQGNVRGLKDTIGGLLYDNNLYNLNNYKNNTY